LAPNKKIRYTRSNLDPNPPHIFGNHNLIPNNFRSQDNQENSADLNLDTTQQNSIQTELTAGKSQVFSAITIASPSSPSALQKIFSTPPSTSYIFPIIPVLPAVTLFSVNMEN